MTIPPILRNKAHDAASVFTADALLREARRQKRLTAGNVPEVCFLDPDGDILRHLKATRQAKLSTEWACYHTELYRFDHDGTSFGIVACVVGASFAVLVTEELFASGCKLVISMTSAGQIVPVQLPPYFVIIDRALRDEGTSYHYLPAADYSFANSDLIFLAQRSLALAKLELSIHTGATWTTDAPFRETADAIAKAREAGLLAVEMEAAALYAFARARELPVLCFAHVTNQMGLVDGDFEKGIADGAQASIAVLVTVAHACLTKPSSDPAGE